MTHDQAADDPHESRHEPTEITYSEQFCPARPRSPRPHARPRAQEQPRSHERCGDPVGTNPEYVSWLRRSSMMRGARGLFVKLSGQGSMWQIPFARPGPKVAVSAAPVWFTA